MKSINGLITISVLCTLFACSGDRLEEKGFQVAPSSIDNKEQRQADGLSKDSLMLPTRPGSILLTGIPRYRLTPLYKVNYQKDGKTFIGSTDFHGSYDDFGTANGNQWHYNFMPGLEAAYGYNLLNISHYDTETQTQKNFFEKPVLVKTLYYPSFSKDTLNYKPVSRNYFMISVYDDDTNKDGFINKWDLRRFYYFDINAGNRRPLVPVDYSVFQSEYDPANDYMYVFAKRDENHNGQGDDAEAINIFWIDLKDPGRTGRLY